MSTQEIVRSIAVFACAFAPLFKFNLENEYALTAIQVLSWLTMGLIGLHPDKVPSLSATCPVALAGLVYTGYKNYEGTMRSKKIRVRHRRHSKSLEPRFSQYI